MKNDSEGSSSKTEYEDKPKLMTMLFVHLCVPSVHCCIDSTAYFDLSLCMFKHSGTYRLVHRVRLSQ